MTKDQREQLAAGKLEQLLDGVSGATYIESVVKLLKEQTGLNFSLKCGASDVYYEHIMIDCVVVFENKNNLEDLLSFYENYMLQWKIEKLFNNS